MEKNFYEWLEIDRKASDYVIEKTYKLLAKKYHPDLQDNNNKKENEEIMKHINEAYETLSNPDKRKQYDIELAENDFSMEDFYELQNENQRLRNIIHELNTQIQNGSFNRSNVQNSSGFQNNTSYDFEQKINNAVNKAYYDAYVQDLKARGFRIRQKKTWKDHLKFLIALGVALAFLIIFFNLPFVKEYIHNLFANNNVLESIIKLF
ncbi:MAG: J domain-containing protein [Clostridia bacterium]|nr:J domain-containing protein [Clostridia bacterium]